MASSEIYNFQSPIAIVAHDAGAANLIINWLRDKDDLEHRVCIGGPGSRLWKTEFGQFTNLCIEEVLKEATFLISGTSYSDKKEHRARQLARKHGIRSVGVIDHWVNDTERFVRGGVQVLPDEIWVAD